jgi:Putative DNA-binding domain
MGLFSKPLSDLTEADLAQLVADSYAERKTMEYKRQLVGPTQTDRKEFLYDASSFANAQGGYLIFGMLEAKGLPVKLDGLSGINPDQEILRLEQLLRSGIRPPLSGVESVSVGLGNGNSAIVMHIPKSWNPPHQVTFQDAFRFYARGSNGRYQIDVDELRSTFALSGTIADKMREFRAERASKIAGGDTPVSLLDGGIISLHVVPFSSFQSISSFPIQEAAREPDRFPPLLSRIAQRHQINFEGLITTSNAEAPPNPQRAYTKVSRNGIVEGVASSIARGQSWIILPHVEAMIVQYARIYMHALHRLGVEPPIAVFAGLLNVDGLRLQQYFDGRGFHEDYPYVSLAATQYHFVESIFQQIPADNQETATALRLTLDHLANAAGLSSSPNFDAQGKYTLQF